MKVVLKWPNHANAVTSGLLELFKENFKTDFTLSVNGNYIQAHHLILAIFCSRVKNEDETTLILGEQSSLSAENVHQLLDFIYTGEIDVEESKLASLKELCRLMGFQELFSIITSFLNTRKRTRAPSRTSKRVQRQNSSSGNEKEKSKEKNDKKNKVRTKENSSDSNMGNGEEPEACSSSESNVESETPKTTNPKYACHFCSYAINYKGSFSRHMITKHQVDLAGNPALKNQKCPQCPKVFYMKEQLNHHVAKVHGEKLYVCEQCGIKFPTKNNLDVHNRGQHLKIKPYTCETCGKQFSYINNLRSHYDTHIPNIVKCEVCGDSVTKGCLKKHMKNKHSTGPKSHQCTLCSYGSWNNWNLKVHLKNVHKVEFDNSDNVT